MAERSTASRASQGMEPPAPKRRRETRIDHGHRKVDDFDWLRDRSDPDALAYLEAENEWCEAHTPAASALARELLDEFTARFSEGDLSVPQLVRHAVEDGERSYWYYSRTIEGQQYPLLTRLPVAIGAPPSAWLGHEDEEILLDLEREGRERAFLGMGSTAMSPDGRVIAATLDTDGDERYELRIFDVVTKTILDAPIAEVARPVAWAGPEVVLYLTHDETGRPAQLMAHRLGTSAQDDRVLVHEEDAAYRLAVKESRCRGWILVTSTSKASSETRLCRVADLLGPGPRLVAPRREGLKYVVEVAGDRLVILHDANGPEGTIAQAPLAATREDQWADVLPYARGVRIDRVDAYRDHVVVSLSRDGRAALHVLARTQAGDIGTGIDVEFDDDIVDVSCAPGPNYDDDLIRIGYSSLTQPPTIYDYSMSTRALTLIKSMPVLSPEGTPEFDPDDYVQHREWAVAEDGTRVPLAIVARRDTPRDGTAPAILYGYGAYGTVMATSFDLLRMSALDRGVVFAIAHVRGGGELGESWHREGMQDKKENSFRDFVACARRLSEAGFADPERIAAQGSSAGGLLVAGAATLEPEVFRAVHADVPFVDPLTTELDPDLPLTVSDWQEWGDPLHDPEAYEAIAAYSPYENVRETEYPALLVTTSLNDARVSHAEGAKWIAALRSTSTTSPERLLLRTQLSAGHGGASGRFDAWQDTAFTLAWLLTELGVGPAAIDAESPGGDDVPSGADADCRDRTE